MTMIPDIGAVRDLIASGRCYDLSHPFRQGMSHSPTQPPYLYSLVKKHHDFSNGPASSAADLFATGIHQGTHIDALGHVSDDGKLFGGHDARSNQDVSRGLAVDDASALTPIIARGRLLDVAGHLGGGPLPAGYAISADDLEATAKRQGLTVERGDVALVRTGWGALFDDAGRYFSHDYAGISLGAAEWLAGRGVQAVGADNFALEVRDPQMPVHRLLLARSGIPILENLNLEHLAADGVHTFLCIAVPLRLIGATGSPIRPIAVV